METPKEKVCSRCYRIHCEETEMCYKCREKDQTIDFDKMRVDTEDDGYCD
jgi:RNA polymerase subunit RPABC4/transcription elongation factor Spt4